MALGVEQRLGSLAVFTRDDFEGDWRLVASGGFSQVFQARHRRWKTQYAIKCSPGLLPEASRYLSARSLFWEEELRAGAPAGTIWVRRDCPLGLSKLQPAARFLRLSTRLSCDCMQLAPHLLVQSRDKVLQITVGELGWEGERKSSMEARLLPLSPPWASSQISDFGLSKWMEQSTRTQYIERSALRGTLSYMPPEMFLQSNMAPGPKYDVYSFGMSSGTSHTKEIILSSRRILGRRKEWRTAWTRTALLIHPVSLVLPPQVSEEVSQELTDSESGGDLKRVLQLSDSESLVPSDEELRIYENKVTPLHFLVAQGSVEQVRLLLAHEVDVDCQTACGYTPLLIATQDQQPELCALLLDHGADANLADEDGWTPLHFTAQNGDDRTARLLLDRGARVDAQEHEGWTPFHLAAQNNFENVARLLVSRQADPNLREAEGKTPLHVAAYFGHVTLVKLLTGQGAELDAQQRNLRTPLHLAVERGKVRAIQHLLKSGAAPDALDRDGYSPLHTAAARGRYLICKMLLRYGASLELPTQQGWTPLHLAAYKGHLEIIHLLAESHADLGAPGSMNWTPLHLAARHGEEEVVAVLLQCGADPNAAEQSGWTPLHLAVQRGSFLSVTHLLEHHADVHAHSKGGWTPAHLAALKGNMAILKVLVRAGAQLDVQAGEGCTPLQLALRSQKQSVAAFLEGKEPSLAVVGSAEPGDQTEV
ncbi:ankyrin repeat and protein kinase domain-containing protein 1 [Myotis lucifugus]|uniref:ankyrin repeat and protein kinase domain-containing protein 1 n=1 Tax=Myotis lucifugus TaxID=59463 RepID=UPI000CCC4D26|nr:ankyrin repeat and protein kinase domain-containing protein 1 [Myotis lucifugus]